MREAKVNDIAKKYKNRPRSKDILMFLLNSEKSATPKQISERIVAHKVVVSKQLLELETDQLVTSEHQNRKDRRRKFYFLTEMGRKVATQLSSPKEE